VWENKCAVIFGFLERGKFDLAWHKVKKNDGLNGKGKDRKLCRVRL